MTEEVFRLIVAAGVVLTCIAFVAQAAILFALYRLTKGGQDRLGPVFEHVGPMLEQAEPVFTSAKKLLTAAEESAPRVTEIVANLSEISQKAREQAGHISALLDDANARTARRLAELDKSVDQAVEHAEQAGVAVKAAVLKPISEVNAIAAGLRTAILTYVQGGRRPSVDHATQDEEMFI